MCLVRQRARLLYVWSSPTIGSRALKGVTNFRYAEMTQSLLQRKKRTSYDKLWTFNINNYSFVHTHLGLLSLFDLWLVSHVIEWLTCWWLLPLVAGQVCPQRPETSSHTAGQGPCPATLANLQSLHTQTERQEVSYVMISHCPQRRELSCHCLIVLVIVIKFHFDVMS